MKRQLLSTALILLSATATHAQVSASRVRPVGQKLEKKIMIFADPEREKEFAALLPLHYRVVEDDEVNAFAVRTRNQIVVNRGLLDFVRNDDELAFILGHEIGHVVVGQLKKVDLERFQEQMAEKLEGMEVTEGMMDELLADLFGVALMDCTGFDMDASVQVIRRFIELRDPETRDALLPWLLDQSKLSRDQAHLVEELRRVAVSGAAEQLREGKVSFCGPKQAKGEQQTQKVPYIWIGRFSVSFETEDRKRQVIETSDAVGLYTEDDFQVMQASEVEARKKLIQEFLVKKYAGKIRVLDVALKGVERQVFQEPEPQPQPR